MFEQFGVLYRGLIIGVMIAAPVGPIGLLCIRRTVRKGLLMGFSTGFGAAMADLFFASIAAFGVAQVTDFIKDYTHSIHLVGGIMLMIGAWHTWFDKIRQPKKENEKKKGGVIKSIASGFIITLTNPVTLFGTLAIITAFGDLHNSWDATTLVTGIFFGSCAWWMLLSGSVALVRKHFTEKTVLWINRGTSILLGIIALWAIIAGVTGNFEVKL